MQGIKNSVLVVLLAFASLLTIPAVCAAGEEYVLFSGEASAVFESWEEEWPSVVSIEDELLLRELFQRPFRIEVSWSGETAPYLVLDSWSGGTHWAQMKPSYILRGTAVYEYDLIEKTYGSGFSSLDRLYVMPSPSERPTEVTEVRCVFPDAGSGDGFPGGGLAGRIVQDIQTGWNLGNSLDAHGLWISEFKEGDPEDYETAWGNPVITKELISAVRESGFNAVRLPVTWAQHIDDRAGYRIDPAWMERVHEAVDYCIENDLYCIIDLHHDTGSGENSWLTASAGCLEKEKEKFAAVWRQIAREFADYDARLLFEGFNEILDENNSWEYPGREACAIVNQFNQLFVDTVREAGGNNRFRCLIVNPYAAKVNEEVLHDFYLPNDSMQNGLIVGCHYYEPYSYCTDQSSGQTSWRENGGEALVGELLGLLHDRFTLRGVPVLITEFAAVNKDNEADRAEWAEYFRKTAAKYGMKCFWWDPGGEMLPDDDLGYYTGKAIYSRHEDVWLFSDILDALTDN